MDFVRFIMPIVFLAACTQAGAITADEVQSRYEAGVGSYVSEWRAFEREAERGESYNGSIIPLADYLRAAMRQRGDAEARAAAAVYLATLPVYNTPITSSDYAEIIEAAPPNSPAWTRQPQDAIRRVAEDAPPDTARAFLEEMARSNEDETVQAWALVRLAQLERRNGRMDAYAATFRRLAPYRELNGLRLAIRLLDPENAVVVGGPAPDFVLSELGSDRVVSSEEFRGRYVLLDFWATWCGPCIIERPIIARAQERFGGDRFTVVSISIDNRPEDAIAFREERWPMDWPNLYAPGSNFSDENFDLGGDVAEAYEITWIGVPHLVLVSPEGEVLALRDQLDGPMLERTLARFLDAG